MSAPLATSALLDVLRRDRAALETSVKRLPSLVPTIACLSRLEAELQRPLRLSILGEFNAGKTSLANLIVGIDSLPTSVVSNTVIPTVIGWAARATVTAVMKDGRRIEAAAVATEERATVLRLEAGLPAPRLATLEVIDLPGLSDPLHTPLSAEDVGLSADLAIWCTVGSQAWKESERSAWTALPHRLRARSLLVATHADHLTSDAERRAVLGRLKTTAGPFFREVVLLATLDALSQRKTATAGEPGDRDAGADAFDTALTSATQAVADDRARRVERVTAWVAERALRRL